MTKKILITIFIIISLYNCSKNKIVNYPYLEDDLIKVYKNFGFQKKPPVLTGSWIKNYNGIVFELKKNASIYSILDGMVIEKSNNSESSKGKSVTIKSKDDLIIIYYHLNDIYIEIGQKVKKGELIGIAGNTGLITVNGLGIEILRNQKNINPNEYLLNTNKLSPFNH